MLLLLLQFLSDALYDTLFRKMVLLFSEHNFQCQVRKKCKSNSNMNLKTYVIENIKL